MELPELPAPVPAHRKRFQIHLSTAVVMMFVAGGLLWANLRERHGTVFGGEEAYEFWSIEFDYNGYGWPLTVHGQLTGDAKYPDGSNYIHSPEVDITRKFTSYFNTVLDAIVAIIILGITWFMCEWPIRRNAERRPTSDV